MLDDLEQVLLILESTYPDLDLSSIRLEVEELIDLTLAEGPLDEIRRRFENVVHSVFNLRTVEEEKVSERIHSFSLLILDPNQLKASIAYEVSNQSISSVRFEEGVVRDLSKVSSDMIKRMFRSIEKGFVPPLSGSGIVRMTDVHKKFIEVKTIGFGGSIRLLGCLEGNTITIKKLYYKKNDGAGGSLQAYAGLCK